MSFLSGAISGLFSGGLALNNANNQGAEDRTFRNGWTQQQLGVVTAANAGKNVMIVYPDHDASKLVNSTTSILECKCPNSGVTVTYQCYVFDSGPFTLKGDGGYLNWAFAGNFVRDKNNVILAEKLRNGTKTSQVTFSKLG